MSATIDSAAIDVLLLDVGGVIVPPADPALTTGIAADLGLTAAELGALFYEWEPWYALSTGRIDADAYWRALGERAGLEPDKLRRLVAPVWEPSGVDEEVMALVRTLRDRGDTRLAILSNATVGLEDTLRGFGVAQFFDPIVNSARIGLRKPDPAAFTRTLEIMDRGRSCSSTTSGATPPLRRSWASPASSSTAPTASPRRSPRAGCSRGVSPTEQRRA